MLLEQITSDGEQDESQQPDMDQNPKSVKKPIRKLKTMKKVAVMDTELRKNVPVSQVKKEDQDFVDAMEDARKKTAAEISNKKTIEIKVTPGARKSAMMNSMRDEEDKKGILQKVYEKVTGKN